MKGIVFYGKNDIRLEELPIPNLSNDEVLIKVKKVALSQILTNEYFYGPYVSKDFLPIVPGHSFGGIITDVGDSKEKRLIGKPVAVLPLVSCGSCYYCKLGYDNMCENLKYYGLIGENGGLSEYAKVKKENIFILDKINSDKITFIEPILIALNIYSEAISKFKHKLGDLKNLKVLILGGGPIGFLTSLIWSIYRKNDNIYLNDLFIARMHKLKEVISYNPKYNINFVEKDYIRKNYFDIVIDTAGFEPLAYEPALLEGFKYLSRGGCLVSIGLYYNNVCLNQGEILLNSKSMLSLLFYRKHLIKELPKILNHINQLNFSKISLKISMEDMIKKGFYKMSIEKEDFIRLEVEC